MINKQLFDYDDYQASPALISRAAANILSEGGSSAFSPGDARCPACRGGSHRRRHPSEAITGRAPHRWPPKALGAQSTRLACAWEQGASTSRGIADVPSPTRAYLPRCWILSDEEREVLFVRLVCEADRAFCMLLDNLRQRLPSGRRDQRAVSGLTPAQARRCLAPDATLGARVS